MTKEEYKSSVVYRMTRYLSYLEYEREIDKLEQFVIASIDRFNLTVSNIEDKSKEDCIFDIIDNLDSVLTYIRHERNILKNKKDDNTFIPMNKVLLNKP